MLWRVECLCFWFIPETMLPRSPLSVEVATRLGLCIGVEMLALVYTELCHCDIVHPKQQEYAKSFLGPLTYCFGAYWR
jgi:hypothetical protein